MPLVCMYQCLFNVSSEIQISNSRHLYSGHCIYMSKDVRIRGYFSTRGVREQKILGNDALKCFNVKKYSKYLLKFK